MYDHQSRLTIAHSIAEDHMAEARRARLVQDARAARTARTEPVQTGSGVGFVARLVGTVRAASHLSRPAQGHAS
jgi:hypothetical protein